MIRCDCDMGVPPAELLCCCTERQKPELEDTEFAVRGGYIHKGWKVIPVCSCLWSSLRLAVRDCCRGIGCGPCCEQEVRG